MTDLDKQIAEFKARGEPFMLTTLSDGRTVAVPVSKPSNPTAVVELDGTAYAKATIQKGQ